MILKISEDFISNNSATSSTEYFFNKRDIILFFYSFLPSFLASFLISAITP